jgi:hypothetical protein
MKAFENNIALKNLCLELTHQSELLTQFSSLSIFEKHTHAQLDLRRLNGFAECLRFERELGIPASLLYAARKIGLELPPDKAATWSNHFFASIRVGADLQGVVQKFATLLLTDPTYGAIAYTDSDARTRVVRSLALCCGARKQTADHFSAACDELNAAFCNAPTHISLEIARSIVWVFLGNKAARQASNLTDALEQSAYARQAKCSSFKASTSVRTGVFHRYAERLLELLRAA